MKIHVVGLQRSGTNFLSNLLLQGFGDLVTQSGDKSIFWKHSFPGEIDGSQIESGENQLVLVTKHPVHWLSSIAAANKHDLFTRRFNSQEPDLIALVDIYNRFHRAWATYLSANTRLMHLRYEDCLFSPELAVKAVGERIGRGYSSPIVLPSRVPYSDKFSKDKKDSYLAGRVSLAPNAQREAELLLDRALLAKLGYSLTPPARDNTHPFPWIS